MQQKDLRTAPLRVIRKPATLPKCKTIVVLGCPRGGTSLVAGAISRLGIFMGNDLGHQYEDPRFRMETSIEQKKEAIRDNNETHDIWGWKLPNTIYYFSDLADKVRNPVFISVYRNPFDVAASSMFHDEREVDFQFFQVPIDHYRKMNEVIKRHSEIPLASCSFERINRKENKLNFLIGLIDFLDVSVTSDQREAALKFIDYSVGYQEPE